MSEILFNEDDRLYLQMMQENIVRMAANSANAKNWLILIVTAFISVACGIKLNNGWLLCALVPIFILWYMDAYYLRLERQLRNREQFFLNIMMRKEYGFQRDQVLFDFKPLNSKVNNKHLRYVETNCQLFNKSVYPLYLVVTFIVLLVTGITNDWFGEFFL